MSRAQWGLCAQGVLKCTPCLAIGAHFSTLHPLPLCSVPSLIPPCAALATFLILAAVVEVLRMPQGADLAPAPILRLQRGVGRGIQAQPVQCAHQGLSQGVEIPAWPAQVSPPMVLHLFSQPFPLWAVYCWWGVPSFSSFTCPFKSESAERGPLPAWLVVSVVVAIAQQLVMLRRRKGGVRWRGRVAQLFPPLLLLVAHHPALKEVPARVAANHPATFTLLYHQWALCSCGCGWQGRGVPPCLPRRRV